MQRKVRDLALFNLAIDSKLRGCDVVSLKVEDIAPHGYAMERATVRQKKTGRPVRFEITEQSRQSVDEYLRVCKRQPGSFLFGGRRGKEKSLTSHTRTADDGSPTLGSAHHRDADLLTRTFEG